MIAGKNVCLRFECGKEDRWSEKLGPFHFVQLTYEALRVADDGDPDAGRVLAMHVGGEWVTLADDQFWSDVVIFNAEAE
jgi:hypothetical protein